MLICRVAFNPGSVYQYPTASIEFSFCCLRLHLQFNYLVDTFQSYHFYGHNLLREECKSNLYRLSFLFLIYLLSHNSCDVAVQRDERILFAFEHSNDAVLVFRWRKNFRVAAENFMLLDILIIRSKKWNAVPAKAKEDFETGSWTNCDRFYFEMDSPW